MLYKHYYSYAMSVCLRYSRSRDEALEILNDSFMKVFDKIELYQEKLSFKAWFRRIIINTSIDYYRKNLKYQKHTEVEQAEGHQQSHTVIDQLSADDILALLGELPDQYRMVFNLYEIEGYAHKEIAEMLNIPEGTSRTVLTRAKKKLRALIQKHFDLQYERPIR